MPEIAADAPLGKFIGTPALVPGRPVGRWPCSTSARNAPESHLNFQVTVSNLFNQRSLRDVRLIFAIDIDRRVAGGQPGR
jgi:hypothetical protein